MNLDNCIHKKWMLRAIRLAILGRGFTSPNPLVGAVIIDKKKIILSKLLMLYAREDPTKIPEIDNGSV